MATAKQGGIRSRKPRGKPSKKSVPRRILFDYVEEVSWKTFDAYPQAIREFMKGRTGVYALYRRDRLYYVGLASNMMGRIRAHLRDRHKGLWDRFNVYLTKNDAHMRELEALILRIARPAGNSVSGRFKGATDLHRQLYRAMMAQDAAHHATLLGGRTARRIRRKKADQGKGREALAGLVDRRTQIRATYKAILHKAYLRRDGYIKLGDERHESFTSAARAITGRTVNGWSFWKYKKGTKWVSVNGLRK
jgi:exonuclease III